jgi:basic membrane protein A
MADARREARRGNIRRMKDELRNWLSWFILTIVTLGLSACAQSLDCFRKDIFCVGLVTDVLGINDHGTNQDTWAGLQESKASGIIDRAEYVEAIDTRDYEKNIAYFAEKGYDVIVTIGVGLRDETLRAADLNPGTVFVGMNQPQKEVRPNIIPITFAEDQMGFAAGVLAARISETQVVGAVCETSGIDSMWRYCEGFRAGAIFANKNIKTQIVYNENGSSEKLFIDETWGYDTAQGLIQHGADVIFAAGGATGQGALRAAAEAQVKSIGTERDQGAVLAASGSSVVTSMVGSASFEVQNVMRQIRGGNAYEPKLSQIEYVPFNEKFPESLTQEMDTLLLSLWIGEIKTDVPFKKP